MKQLERVPVFETEGCRNALERKSTATARAYSGPCKVRPKPPATFVLTRGSPHSPAKEVAPAFPKLLGGGVPEIPSPEDGARSAGRRKVLAEWLASKDNWMTARVMVNRIWMYYFGRGIVRSPNNFGLMGEAPTHPELLDYLATELMDHDWSMKSIHRTILLSTSYRLSFARRPTIARKRPAKRYLLAAKRASLERGAVTGFHPRGNGTMNEQQYGPSMYPTLSPKCWQANLSRTQLGKFLGFGPKPKKHLHSCEAVIGRPHADRLRFSRHGLPRAKRDS